MSKKLDPSLTKYIPLAHSCANAAQKSGGSFDQMAIASFVGVLTYTTAIQHKVPQDQASRAAIIVAQSIPEAAKAAKISTDKVVPTDKLYETKLLAAASMVARNVDFSLTGVAVTDRRAIAEIVKKALIDTTLKLAKQKQLSGGNEFCSIDGWFNKPRKKDYYNLEGGNTSDGDAEYSDDGDDSAARTTTTTTTTTYDPFASFYDLRGQPVITDPLLGEPDETLWNSIPDADDKPDDSDKITPKTVEAAKNIYANKQQEKEILKNPPELPKEEKKPEKEEKPGFFRRQWKKIASIGIAAMAGLALLGGAIAHWTDPTGGLTRADLTELGMRFAMTEGNLGMMHKLRPYWQTYPSLNQTKLQSTFDPTSIMGKDMMLEAMKEGIARDLTGEDYNEHVRQFFRPSNFISYGSPQNLAEENRRFRDLRDDVKYNIWGVTADSIFEPWNRTEEENKAISEDYNEALFQTLETKLGRLYNTAKHLYPRLPGINSIYDDETYDERLARAAIAAHNSGTIEPLRELAYSMAHAVELEPEIVEDTLEEALDLSQQLQKDQRDFFTRMLSKAKKFVLEDTRDVDTIYQDFISHAQFTPDEIANLQNGTYTKTYIPMIDKKLEAEPKQVTPESLEDFSLWLSSLPREKAVRLYSHIKTIYGNLAERNLWFVKPSDVMSHLLPMYASGALKDIAKPSTSLKDIDTLFDVFRGEKMLNDPSISNVMRNYIYTKVGGALANSGDFGEAVFNEFPGLRQNYREAQKIRYIKMTGGSKVAGEIMSKVEDLRFQNRYAFNMFAGFYDMFCKYAGYLLTVLGTYGTTYAPAGVRWFLEKYGKKTVEVVADVAESLEKGFNANQEEFRGSDAAANKALNAAATVAKGAVELAGATALNTVSTLWHRGKARYMQATNKTPGEATDAAAGSQAAVAGILDKSRARETGAIMDTEEKDLEENGGEVGKVLTKGMKELKKTAKKAETKSKPSNKDVDEAKEKYEDRKKEAEKLLQQYSWLNLAGAVGKDVWNFGKKAVGATTGAVKSFLNSTPAKPAINPFTIFKDLARSTAKNMKTYEEPKPDKLWAQSLKEAVSHQKKAAVQQKKEQEANMRLFEKFLSNDAAAYDKSVQQRDKELKLMQKLTGQKASMLNKLAKSQLPPKPNLKKSKTKSKKKKIVRRVPLHGVAKKRKTPKRKTPPTKRRRTF